MYSSLSGGELFEKITAEGYTMSEAEVINYMRQICEGVKHMHERNIIHLGKCNVLVEEILTERKCKNFDTVAYFLYLKTLNFSFVHRYQTRKCNVPNIKEHQHQVD